MFSLNTKLDWSDAQLKPVLFVHNMGEHSRLASQGLVIHGKLSGLIQPEMVETTTGGDYFQSMLILFDCIHLHWNIC